MIQEIVQEADPSGSGVGGSAIVKITGLPVAVSVGAFVVGAPGCLRFSTSAEPPAPGVIQLLGDWAKGSGNFVGADANRVGFAYRMNDSVSDLHGSDIQLFNLTFQPDPDDPDRGDLVMDAQNIGTVAMSAAGFLYFIFRASQVL